MQSNDALNVYSQNKYQSQNIISSESHGKNNRKRAHQCVPPSRLSYLRTSTREETGQIITRKEINEAFGDLSVLVDFSDLNSMQSACFFPLVTSEMNMLITAPTGTGKTLLLELAIIHLLATNKSLIDMQKSTSSSSSELQTVKNLQHKQKALYICPTKAIAMQKFYEWQKIFVRCAFKVMLDLGDSDIHDINQDEISQCNIIITTPERWDITTRNWKGSSLVGLVDSVSLLLLDEIQILNDDRGATLEALVTRMKLMDEFKKNASPSIPRFRCIAVSGTIPNPEDVAQWLNVPKAGIYIFDESYRPVPIDIKVLSYGNTKNLYFLDQVFTKKLRVLIGEYADSKPTIIFCGSRREAERSARVLLGEVSAKKGSLQNHTNYLPLDQLQNAKFLEIVRQSNIDNKLLRQCIFSGIGFHHAALSLNDRRFVEENFSERGLRVICCTSTLAMGVNLPSRLVIVKGTTEYKGSSRVEMQAHNVIRMLGRAGRVGFDTKGIGLVLTTEDQVSYYEALQSDMRGFAGDKNRKYPSQYIESHFHEHMCNHLNANITLGYVRDVTSAQHWLARTFFWVRLHKNPAHYGICPKTLPQIYTAKLIDESLAELKKTKCIILKNSPSNEEAFYPTEIGQLISKYCTSVYTLKVMLSKLNSDTDVRGVLTCLCLTEEMKEFRLRLGDKQSLNSMCRNIRYTLVNNTKERGVKTDWQKIFVLIQAQLLDCHNRKESDQNWSLQNESVRMWAILPRMLHLFHEFCVLHNLFAPIKHCLMLLRTVKHKMWENSPFLTSQLHGVTPEMAYHFAQNGIFSFRDILLYKAELIEKVSSRDMTFVENLRDQVLTLPICFFGIKQLEHISSTNEITFRVIVGRHSLRSADSIHQQSSSFRNLWYTLLIGDSRGETIFYTRFLAKGSSSCRGMGELHFDDLQTAIDRNDIDKQSVQSLIHHENYRYAKLLSHTSADGTQCWDIALQKLPTYSPVLTIHLVCESFHGLDSTAVFKPTFSAIEKCDVEEIIENPSACSVEDSKNFIGHGIANELQTSEYSDAVGSIGTKMNTQNNASIQPVNTLLQEVYLRDPAIPTKLPEVKKTKPSTTIQEARNVLVSELSEHDSFVRNPNASGNYQYISLHSPENYQKFNSPTSINCSPVITEQSNEIISRKGDQSHEMDVLSDENSVIREIVQDCNDLQKSQSVPVRNTSFDGKNDTPEDEQSIICASQHACVERSAPLPFRTNENTVDFLDSFMYVHKKEALSVKCAKIPHHLRKIVKKANFMPEAISGKSHTCHHDCGDFHTSQYSTKQPRKVTAEKHTYPKVCADSDCLKENPDIIRIGEVNALIMDHVEREGAEQNSQHKSHSTIGQAKAKSRFYDTESGIPSSASFTLNCRSQVCTLMIREKEETEYMKKMVGYRLDQKMQRLSDFRMQKQHQKSMSSESEITENTCNIFDSIISEQFQGGSDLDLAAYVGDSFHSASQNISLTNGLQLFSKALSQQSDPCNQLFPIATQGNQSACLKRQRSSPGTFLCRSKF